jgi:hypothetical protein
MNAAVMPIKLKCSKARCRDARCKDEGTRDSRQQENGDAPTIHTDPMPASIPIMCPGTFSKIPFHYIPKYLGTQYRGRNMPAVSTDIRTSRDGCSRYVPVPYRYLCGSRGSRHIAPECAVNRNHARVRTAVPDPGRLPSVPDPYASHPVLRTTPAVTFLASLLPVAQR